MKDKGSFERNIILEGNVFFSLTRFTIPILFSLLLQGLYGAVDLWVVSQFGYSSDVSAVSTGSQTMLIVTGVITGLSVGITIMLASAKGRNDNQECANIVGTSIWIFTILSIFLTLILVLFAPLISKALHSPPEAFGKTMDYIIICGLGVVFIVAFNVISAILCGIGDSKTPLYFVGIACIFNIVGDIVFVRILNLGAKGAAYATVAAQAISVVISLLVSGRTFSFKLTRSSFKLKGIIVMNILRIGSPMALLRMFTEISYLIMLGFVNIKGVVASSGVGIAEKLVMFIVLVPTSYMTSISTFVAQNRGAGQMHRVRSVLKIGLISALTVGGGLSYLSFFHGDVLSRLFTSDPEIIEASALFLKATALECFLLSAVYSLNGYFTGFEYSAFVMIEGIAASLLVRIPYAWFASSMPDSSLFDIGLSTTFAALFMLILSICFYFWKFKIKKKEN